MNMKNLVRAVALAAAVAAAPSVLLAQKNQFEVGSKVLNVGVVIGDEVGGGIGLGAGFEVGIKDIAGQVRLGIGGAVSILRNDYGTGVRTPTYTYEYTNTVMPIVVFVNGHYQLEQVPKLDLFAGPVVGITRYSTKSEVRTGGSTTASTASSSDPAIGIQAGGRYELAPRIAASAQLSAGNNLPFLTAGIAIKF